MAINYGSLKESEKELIHKFYDYLEHTYKMHLEVISAFENIKNPEECKKIINSIYELEKVSNITQADLLDECTWMISKEQPQASHLRFVIAIINSINDLERICDYANNIAKFLERHNYISEECFNIILTLEKLAITNYKSVFDYFRSNDAVTTYKFAEQLQNSFSQEFGRQLKAIRDIYINKSSYINDNSELLTAPILALKNVERIMDHIMNIIEYFIYIKESNFFFNKKVQ